MNILKQLRNVGIDQYISFVEKRNIRGTNVVNLVYLFWVGPALMGLIILLTNQGYQSYTRSFPMMLMAIFSLYLNSRKQYVISKIITSLNLFLSVICFPIVVFDFMRPGLFLWLPWAIIIIGIIPFYIFSYKNEKKYILLFGIFYSIICLTLDHILMSVYDNRFDVSFIQENYVFLEISKAVAITFLYISIYNLKYNDFKTNQELLFLSEQLNEKNQKLIDLNLMQESIIAERTQKISKQNERIKELAFTNAHRIRAGIARIIGLINVLYTANLNSSEKDFFNNQILENANELDKVTKELSRELIEEE